MKSDRLESLVRAHLRLSAVAVALLLAGCADLHWEKPGASTAALDQDLEQCTQRARLDARREEVPRLDAPLVFRADPQGRPVVVPSSPRGSDRFLAEHDLTAACMRAKGYVQQQHARQ
jgi:hypothetical protein